MIRDSSIAPPVDPPAEDAKPEEGQADARPLGSAVKGWAHLGGSDTIRATNAAAEARKRQAARKAKNVRMDDFRSGLLAAEAERRSAELGVKVYEADMLAEAIDTWAQVYQIEPKGGSEP